ncbi:MAG: hypothetical protein J6V41_06225 [Kiritimatiellae bacterium]|jgi:hypothetical protein|nr:hypothetical protein [Kiritimatiellia bacterium]MBQ2281394.1 hypothetical protein [Kiritimatiellia bacterium]
MTEIDNDMNLGEQPIAKILEEYGLKTHDLVVASEVQMTHKMVQRAMKGRRLTANTKNIVLNALRNATGVQFKMTDLFNY